MFRFAFVLSVGLAVVVAAVAAGGAGAASPPVQTVVLSGWPESPEATVALENVIGAFEASHPSIRVDYEPLATYEPDIEADFAGGGTPPDVFYVDSSLAPDWIARGYMLPLGGLATRSGFNMGHFFPVLRRAFEGPGGQPYGFPKDWSPLGMYTNDALLAQAGVSAPSTWTQLHAAAEQIRAATGVTPICLSADWARLLAFVEENGASLATIDSEQAAAAVQFYSGLVRDGLAATPDMLGEPWCGQALADGQVAMAFEGNWLLPVMRQTSLAYSIHPMPSSLRRGNVAFTVAYAMASSSQHKQAAWELISYLTGRTGMQQWVNGAVAQPSRDDVRPVPGTEVFQGEAPIATGWQFGVGFNDAVNLGNSELGNVFAGTESIDQMLADFKAALGE